MHLKSQQPLHQGDTILLCIYYCIYFRITLILLPHPHVSFTLENDIFPY